MNPSLRNPRFEIIPSRPEELILPQCLDVERTVLGSMLVSQMAAGEALNLLDDTCFYAAPNRIIYATMREMFEKKIPIDTITLANALRKKGLFESVGEEPYIAELAESIATSANIEFYSNILREKAARRAAIEAGYQTIERAFNLDIPFTGEACRRWSISDLTPKRFFDYPPKEHLFIITRLLAAGIVGFIYGEGGSYKSLAALWLVVIRACIEINNSLRWLARFEVQCGKSIFFSAEDVEIDLHHRTPAILNSIHAERIEIPLSAYQNIVSENCLIVSREQWVADGELFLIDENGNRTRKYYQVVDLIKTFGASLVIFETLSRIANVDENDNRAAARVVGVLEMLRDDTGATILCIAHSSKVNRGGKTDTHGQNGMRGGGAFMDNARFGLWFRALPKQDGADRLEIINSKTFRTQRADPFKVKINYPAFSIDETEGNENVFDAVVEYVREHPGASTRDIRSNVTGKTTVITQALKDGKEEGVLIFKGKGKGFYVE